MAGKCKAVRWLVIAWAAAALIAAALGYKIMNPQIRNGNSAFTLAAVQTEIENRFERVDHITAAEMTAMAPAQLLIFDTRPAKEFAVSHIENALRINPDMDAAEFTQTYGAAAGGKTLIFYCSVGMRSSNLAETLTAKLPQAAGIYNLRGGLFGWHNEGRPLVNAAGPTESVHPYDENWEQLVTRQEKLSYN
jgi:rhodanese-related sulfurtransferase